MSEVISDEYLKTQVDLHESQDEYGSMSVEYAPTIAQFAVGNKFESILDYGAGKKRLLKGLREWGFGGDYTPYDPAMPEYDSIPDKEYDLLVSIDVLEHIEPDLLDNVLDEMKTHTSKFAFLTVSTVPAQKILSDGRNAHLIQKPFEWWRPKIEERWKILNAVGISGRGQALVTGMGYNSFEMLLEAKAR